MGCCTGKFQTIQIREPVPLLQAPSEMTNPLESENQDAERTVHIPKPIFKLSNLEVKEPEGESDLVTDTMATTRLIDFKTTHVQE